MALTVNMREAKKRLSRLVSQVLEGEEILIARAGKPVARLTRIERKVEPRRFGTAKGNVRIAKDFDSSVPGLEDFYQ